MRLIVDGFNVIGARPDGWWRDRPGAARRLVADLQALVQVSGDDITVVLEGSRVGGPPEGEHGGVRVRHARRSGPDAADDLIVALVAGDPDPGGLVVFTADRDLADRVRRLGAGVAGPSTLRARLDVLP